MARFISPPDMGRRRARSDVRPELLTWRLHGDRWLGNWSAFRGGKITRKLLILKAGSRDGFEVQRKILEIRLFLLTSFEEYPQ